MITSFIKKIWILLFFIFLSSCKEDKVEFIKSDAIPNLYLLKNTSNINLTKKAIKDFLEESNPEHGVLFYEYTWVTIYFINNKEELSGGFSAEELSFYPDEHIASFLVLKCKNNPSELVGKLRFSGKYGDWYKPDTLIYKCK